MILITGSPHQGYASQTKMKYGHSNLIAIFWTASNYFGEVVYRSSEISKDCNLDSNSGE